MAQTIQLWVFCIMATKEVAEVFRPLVMEVKTKMAKDLETSGAAQNVEIRVLPWNVSPCQSCTLIDPLVIIKSIEDNNPHSISMHLHIFNFSSFCCW